MILIDYNQVALASSLAFQNDLKRGDEDDVTNLIRHVTLNSIKSYKQKYKKYGDIVIACDGKNYWRRDIFPPYKGSRKKSRDKSDLNWSLIFDTLDTVRSELKEVFPYKVIHEERCEADDVIAVLVKNTQQLGQYEEVMIISSDKDFKQLMQYDNVKQFSPMTKKLVTIKPKELKEILAICRHKDLHIIYAGQSLKQVTPTILGMLSGAIFKRPSNFEIMYGFTRREFKKTFRRFAEVIEHDDQENEYVITEKFDDLSNFYYLSLNHSGWYECDLPSFWSDKISKCYKDHKKVVTKV